MDALRHLVRYLMGKHRMVFRFYHQLCDGVLVQWVDTDFAGRHQTRRSTSAAIAIRGGHVLKHYSVTQATVALSSAEAELTGICRGASHGLGLLSLCEDLNIELSLDVRADATAAIGICRRRGLGRIRHLACADLWVHEQLQLKADSLAKVPGSTNPADMLT